MNFITQGRHKKPRWLREYQSQPLIPQQAALFLLIDAYLSGGLDPYITYKSMHSLMYLLQVVGEPLDLQFRIRGTGQVWSDSLDYFVPDEYFEPGKRELDKCRALLAEQGPETLKRVERVVNLISGFESEKGLSLLTHCLVKGVGEGAQHSLECAFKRLQEHGQVRTDDSSEVIAEVLTEIYS